MATSCLEVAVAIVSECISINKCKLSVLVGGSYMVNIIQQV